MAKRTSWVSARELERLPSSLSQGALLDLASRHAEEFGRGSKRQQRTIHVEPRVFDEAFQS
jgi:hypothetical protein